MQAGLDAIGFAGAEPFDAARRTIEDRRGRGCAAGMQFTYRNPARSTDPGRALAGARSLVVGARRYDRQEPPASRPAAQARIGRFTWTDHYGALRASLGAVADVLVGDGWAARVLVDDNALVDRAAAQRAGLGWFGRNTNLLIGRAGSWFVLGSVVTDAPLPAGTPVEDGCGTCRRCVEACPTGALSDGGALDGRRCLAWLLQAPGWFPVEHRVAVGDRIYGCDTCQERCPINRLAARRSPPPEAEAGATASTDAVALLAASDKELLAAWGRWWIAGRDPRWLRRNALLAIGNAGRPGDPAVAGALEAALASPDAIVRGHAVWACARLGRRDLISLVSEDPDDGVRAEVARAADVPLRPDAVTVGGPSLPAAPSRAIVT